MAGLLDPHRQRLAERAPNVNYSARIPWHELRAQRAVSGSDGSSVTRWRRGAWPPLWPR